MAATVFTEVQHPFDGLLEGHWHISIDEVIVTASQTIVEGAILGAIGVVANETIAGAVGAGNTGTSTIGSITSSVGATNGVYTITLLATGATAAFEVERPDGSVDGTGKVGTAYAGQVNFTITAGGTPTIGDVFTVSVTRPAGEAGEVYKAWAPGATDGSQVPVAIALFPAVTAAGATAKIAALRRNGAFRASAVQWPSVTAAQKASAIATLNARGIVLR